MLCHYTVDLFSQMDWPLIIILPILFYSLYFAFSWFTTDSYWWWYVIFGFNFITSVIMYLNVFYGKGGKGNIAFLPHSRPCHRVIFFTYFELPSNCLIFVSDLLFQLELLKSATARFQINLFLTIIALYDAF